MRHEHFVRCFKMKRRKEASCKVDTNVRWKGMELFMKTNVGKKNTNENEYLPQCEKYF